MAEDYQYFDLFDPIVVNFELDDNKNLAILNDVFHYLSGAVFEVTKSAKNKVMLTHK